MPFAIPSANATGKVVELWRRNGAGADTITGYGIGVVAAGQLDQEQAWWLKDRNPDLWFPNIAHYLKVSTDQTWSTKRTIKEFANTVRPLFVGGTHLYVKAHARFTQNITGALPAGTMPPMEDPGLRLWGASQGDVGLTQIHVGTNNLLKGHVHTKRVDNSASVEYWFLNQDYDFELTLGTSPNLLSVSSGEHFSELRRSGWPAGSTMAGTSCRYCTVVPVL